MERPREILEKSGQPYLLDPIKKKLAAYLHRMNQVLEKEFRLAMKKDLREITPNVATLQKHLDKLERKGYIAHELRGHEHHYCKSEKGRRMEQILLNDWPIINDWDTDWRGKLE